MNTILNYYRNDGSLVKFDDSSNTNFDYVQILLLGKKSTNNAMLVSKGDLEFVINFKWYLSKSGYPSTYGTFDNSIKYSRPVALHQILYRNIDKGNVVDHINRDRLDNRRENLRVCTALQNSYNRSKPSNSKTNYKGVTQTKNGKYVARVTKDGKKHEIRNINTEKEAAIMYDIMAEELFGPYAGKNFQ